MPEHPAQAFYGHSLVDGQDGKAVSGAMHRDVLSYTQFFHDLSYIRSEAAILDNTENSLMPFLLIMTDNL